MTYRELHHHQHEQETRGLLGTVKLILILLAIAAILIIVEGCGGGGGASAGGRGQTSTAATPAASTASAGLTARNMSGPTKSLIRDPTVLILGDQPGTSWLTPAVLTAHPLWISGGPPEPAPPAPALPPEDSGHTLARLPGLLLAHESPPQVVVIFTGTYDIADPTWTQPCGPANSGQALTIQTCPNLVEMIALSQAAGARVLVTTLPIVQGGSLGTPLLEANPAMADNEELYNRNLRLYDQFHPPGWTEDGLVDIELAFAGTTPGAGGIEWTTDGTDFSASGSEVVTSVVEAAVASLGVGGAR